jgi:hypothetical protein
VRAPFDGLRRAHGPLAVVAVIAIAWVILAALGASLTAARHQKSLRSASAGPAWLALPLDPRVLARHLEWESRTHALVAAVPACAVLVAAWGLVPWYWLPLLAAVFAVLLVEAARLGCIVGLIASRGVEPPRARADSSSAARAARSRARRLPSARWQRMPSWRAMLDATFASRGVTHACGPRRSCPRCSASSAARVAVPGHGCEHPAARASTRGRVLPRDGVRGDARGVARGACGLRSIRRAATAAGRPRRRLVGARRPGHGAPRPVPAISCSRSDSLPARDTCSCCGIAGATLAIAALGINYGVTLFPRADTAKRMLGLSLGLAVIASLMFPLAGWIVLTTAIVHSSRRLSRWDRLEDS